MRKFVLCAALLCAAGFANAETFEARSGNDRVRISDAPCPAVVQAHIPEEVREMFHGGSAIIGGKTFQLCWTARPDGVVHLVFDDGDHGRAHASQFRYSPGV